MYKRLLVTLFITSIITSCNPREPRTNPVQEEIEDLEDDCCPKGINYGPTPGG